MVKNILLLITVFLPAISGCTFNMEKDEASGSLEYYRYGGSSLKSVGRVLMLEMENLSTNQDISRELTTALSEEIRKKQIFGLETLYHTDPKWKNLSISKNLDISMQQLSDIQSRFSVDAVLYGKVMHYRPYPRNSIGLKLKLEDCTTGQLLWAVEGVWDSTDAKIEERAKSFFSTEMRSGYDPMNWKIVMVSPRIYNKFITHEISEALR